MTYTPTFGTELTDIPRNSTIYTESISAFNDPVLDQITLEDFNHYIYTQPFNTGINEFIILIRDCFQIFSS